MRYVSQTGQSATPTARITCVARHLYPTRPRFRVHSTVAPRECGIGQCVRLIAGVCTHYVVYNISKKKNTVDKSKIKDKRKVKPKDKSWVKIGWRTKNRKGWCVQKR